MFDNDELLFGESLLLADFLQDLGKGSSQTPGSSLCVDNLRCCLHTFCKASFDMDMAAEICRKLTIARKSREKAGQAALLLKLSRFGPERM